MLWILFALLLFVLAVITYKYKKSKNLAIVLGVMASLVLGYAGYRTHGFSKFAFLRDYQYELCAMYGDCEGWEELRKANMEKEAGSDNASRSQTDNSNMQNVTPPIERDFSDQGGQPDIDYILRNHIESKSKGYITLDRFEVERSGLTTLYGQEFYQAKGTLYIKAVKEFYKRGNNIEGYFQNFKCYDAPKDERIGAWESIFDYKHYGAGSVINLGDKTYNFKKYDQGWMLP